MNGKPTLDMSHLRSYAFGPHGLMWWGTMGIVAIEGTMFVILIVTYFYLRNYVPEWPPNLPPPDLLYGTLNTLVLLVSAVPNQWVKSAAERQDLRAVRIGLLVCLVLAGAFLVLRAFELTALHCSWDTNAYGSAIWMLLGFHTFHLATDALDTSALTAASETGKCPFRYVAIAPQATALATSPHACPPIHRLPSVCRVACRPITYLRCSSAPARCPTWQRLS